VTDCTACRVVKNVSVFAVKYDFVERLVWYSALCVLQLEPGWCPSVCAASARVSRRNKTEASKWAETTDDMAVFARGL